MSSQYQKEEHCFKQKPQVFVKHITFNDGSEIELNKNSIVVFAGANNCGKSQILKDIEKKLDGYVSAPSVVAREFELEYIGDIDELSFFSQCFSPDSDGRYHALESSTPLTISTIVHAWRSRDLHSGLHKLFVKRLSTKSRLVVSNALQRDRSPEKHPIFKLNQNRALANRISEYFHQAFGVDLVANLNSMATIPLHIGIAPDPNNFTMAQQDEYYQIINNLPLLEEQGDGMRSFASILLDTFTSDRCITLIDEPEAFLHPPQARMLGKMLVQNNPQERQLFLSTHSEDFLQGLLDADNENVTIIRIQRENTINNISVLKNDEIKQLWSNPILRYSNVLDGLFHEKVVVCESDYDCLFYQAVLNAIYEAKNEVAPDILFTHCGGKARAKDIVAALKAVDVPVVAICDFDLINSSQVFNPIVTAFGEQWQTFLDIGMRTIYDSMNAKNSRGIDAWAAIKKVGAAGFTDDEPSAYEAVEKLCQSIGLFVVPVGEIECFDKTINKDKKEWVYHVLEHYDLANEPKLEETRKFVQRVADYKPMVRE